MYFHVYISVYFLLNTADNAERQLPSQIPNKRHFQHLAGRSSLFSRVFLILQLKEHTIISEKEHPQHNNGGLVFLHAPPPPLQHNNKLPDQLAFPLKSYTLCSKPELHIIGGIIVALRWFEVAD